MTTLFVPGKPAPQGSKRHVGGGRLIESSKYLKPWRTTIATAATLDAVPLVPKGAPVFVRLEFVMPRPKSLPKTKPTPPHTKRPDVDKLERGVLDALTGIAWVDDSQVVALSSRKRYAEPGEQSGVIIHYVDLLADTETRAAA